MLLQIIRSFFHFRKKLCILFFVYGRDSIVVSVVNNWYSMWVFGVFFCQMYANGQTIPQYKMMPNTVEKDENHNVIKSIYRNYLLFLTEYLHAILFGLVLLLLLYWNWKSIKFIHAARMKKKHIINNLKTYQNVMIIICFVKVVHK